MEECMAVAEKKSVGAILNIKELVASSGQREAHIMITAADPCMTFAEQMQAVDAEYRRFLAEETDGLTPVFKRWFLSDSANQASMLPEGDECATSIVEQAPLSQTKIALWVWMMEGAEAKKIDNGRFAVEAIGHTHIFEGTQCRPQMDPYHATLFMLTSTEEMLKERNGSLLDSCVRTWLFVENVDVNYHEVVKGRNQAFGALGLSTDTRFIASTGIGGRRADPSAIVGMDSYSVIGLKEGQMRQLNAPDHLNPTYEYGVAFERATSVDYSDRRHMFISGTASIDNKGRVMWPGDIRRQTLRMWENVESLLATADCNWENVGQIIVYLRDPADYFVVNKMFSEKFPDIPYVVVHAPVCRPGWLVEMECMAMKAI